MMQTQFLRHCVFFSCLIIGMESRKVEVCDNYMQRLLDSIPNTSGDMKVDGTSLIPDRHFLALASIYKPLEIDDFVKFGSEGPDPTIKFRILSLESKSSLKDGEVTLLCRNEDCKYQLNNLKREFYNWINRTIYCLEINSKRRYTIQSAFGVISIQGPGPGLLPVDVFSSKTFMQMVLNSRTLRENEQHVVREVAQLSLRGNQLIIQDLTGNPIPIQLSDLPQHEHHHLEAAISIFRGPWKYVPSPDFAGVTKTIDITTF